MLSLRVPYAATLRWCHDRVDMASGGSPDMIDALFVLLMVAFFALSFALVRWLDRI